MKFDFLNTQGEKLSGKLEMPNGRPRAYAIFAHCFTCSKNTKAASFISRSLSKKGIAVLRFDFTGLGGSGGDFSNTNFSSNVQDLILAFKALKKQHEAPKILIGHSLGGAAVLAAASQLDEVESVVTIGAPSSTDHVAHLFEAKIDEICEEGEAEVNLMGRKFKIKHQFIKDINEVELLTKVQGLRKNLLIMHSPIDSIVSIDHAAQIYTAAKHPKSFISLDQADHLVSQRRDAEYIAGLVSSWVSKHLPEKFEQEHNDKIDEGWVVVQSREGALYTQDAYTNKHHLVVDEPENLKGADLGMAPYELLLSALGGCTAITMKMYAERKGLPLESSKVRLTHKKIKTSAPGDGLKDLISKDISITGKNLTEENKKRLLEIAEKCPVNRSLKAGFSVEVEVKS
jgi:putative redox protein